MSRAFRSDSLPIPALFCPTHGEQPGRTVCRWCSFGKHIFMPEAVSSSSRNGLGVSGRAILSGGVAPFYTQSEHCSDDPIAQRTHG